MNPTMKGKYTRLANLKAQIKALEPEKRVETSQGNLGLNHRDNWSKADNHNVINAVGLAAFLEQATITKTGIEKAGGVKAVRDMVAKGQLEIKSTSRYYTLRK